MTTNDIKVYRWAVLENIATLVVAAWLAYLVSPWGLLILFNLNLTRFRKSGSGA